MPPKRSTPKTLHRAWELRRELTPAEMKLWGHLRILHTAGIHFRKQHAIGRFIVDFCAPRRKLVIELDGSQHLDQPRYDDERTQFLESQGYTVIRFWNHQVTNDIEGVMRAIMNAAGEIPMR